MPPFLSVGSIKPVVGGTLFVFFFCVLAYSDEPVVTAKEDTEAPIAVTDAPVVTEKEDTCRGLADPRPREERHAGETGSA